MRIHFRLSFVLCSLLLITTTASFVRSKSLNRQSFPDGFLFGAGTSAYQVEGASRVDGKGPSIWDVFTHEYPDKIADHGNGDIADEMYYRFKGDVEIVKEIGFDVLRISISWPRILPGGKISRGVNQVAVKYYNDLIDEIIANGIQPFVTLFHWDSPQALEEEYGGFRSYNIVDDYLAYVALCFREFGDRVKYWITVNEPNNYSFFGYANGEYAPGRCSKYINNCTVGNSATEPYQVTHNLLLAHGYAVQLYKQRYQKSQKGVIGMTVSCNWFVPYSNMTSDLEAAARAFDFKNGWILEPITYGEYPKTMRSLVGSRLPKFTAKESEILKRSYDYVGVNYYTASYATNDNSSSSSTELSYTTDSHVVLTKEKDGVPIGEPTSGWIYIYPKGIRDMTKYVKDQYGDPPIIVTENGVGEANNFTLPISEAVQDYQRIKYHNLHLASLLKAIELDNVYVQGYFVWSILDDFEWADGFKNRFGLNYVDYKRGLTRYPKYSAQWFKRFLEKENASRGHSPL